MSTDVILLVCIENDDIEVNPLSLMDLTVLTDILKTYAQQAKGEAKANYIINVITRPACREDFWTSRYPLMS